MASINTGLLSLTAISRAAFTTLYTANTSLPSTRAVVIPYPDPREAGERTSYSGDDHEDILGAVFTIPTACTVFLSNSIVKNITVKVILGGLTCILQEVGQKSQN